MKIMTIFIDMISGEKLNLCNSNAERTELDDFIEKFGGTLYANCYTPAPDTPRSAGCMWTGLYPKENGCKYRTRYPMFYMDEEKENIWSVLKKQNYNIQAFMRAPTLATGVLPKCVEENVYPDGNDLDGFLDSIRLQDNTFIMIYLPDFHTYLDIFQASIGGGKKRRSVCKEAFGKNLRENPFGGIRSRSAVFGPRFSNDGRDTQTSAGGRQGADSDAVEKKGTERLDGR